MIPGDTGHHLAYATGYLQLGMLREAGKELQQVAEELRASELSLALGIELARRQEHWSKMSTLARRFVRTHPDKPDGYLHLSYAMRRWRSVAQAFDALRLGEDRHPGHAIIKFNLGCYAALLGRSEEAVRYVLAAVQLDSDVKEAAFSDPDLISVRARLHQVLV